MRAEVIGIVEYVSYDDETMTMKGFVWHCELADVFPKSFESIAQTNYLIILIS